MIEEVGITVKDLHRKVEKVCEKTEKVELTIRHCESIKLEAESPRKKKSGAFR